MKSFTKSWIAKSGILAVLITLSTNAISATFTAVASGNFSNTVTWGGTAPGSIITADVIIIPSGITVTLDQDLLLNGALSVLTVNGTLSSTAGSTLALNVGSLTGSGSVTLDSLVLNLASGFAYTGSIVADHLISTGASVSAAANITVNDTLNLAGGVLTIAAGNLTLGNGATIMVSGGDLMVTGTGNAVLTSSYDVVYTTSSTTTGVELTGAGLMNVTINVPAGSSVTLGSDLNVNGMLSLTSGDLVLNGNDLTFNGNATIAASGSGTVNSSSGSNITINAANNLGGTLNFSSSGNTVNNLTINFTDSNATVNVGTDFTVTGQLNLQSGTVSIDDNELTIAASGDINGGSTASYVITGTDGSLTLNVGAGTSDTFHVGTSANYAPAIIISTPGSASGDVSVGVNADILAAATTGADISATQPVVDATWFIDHSASAGVDMDVQLMWSTNMEVNGFDRTQAAIAHFLSGSWDVDATSSATVGSNGLWTMTRTDVTADGAFAVVDEDANLDVKQVQGNAEFAVYPNPAVHTLHMKLPARVQAPVQVQIYNLTGQLVKSDVLNIVGGSINVADLPSGFYNVQLSNQEFSITQKFVKQ